MAGTNRITGKPLDGWPHAVQSYRDILIPTRFGDRVQREDIGSIIPGAILRNYTNENAIGIFWALAVLAELFEPRLKIRRIKPDVSVSDRRSGKLGIEVFADYRPRGHLGDFTVSKSNVSFFL